MKKILVFGATGFLGREIVSALVVAGFRVEVLSRSLGRASSIFSNSVKIHIGDLSADSYPLLSNYDVIVNCSGEIKNESIMHLLHVDSLSTALNSLPVDGRTHWIQISSVGVYGAQSDGIICEDHSFHPIGTYEKTKAEGETLVKKICKLRSIPYTIIRPSNVFGNGMSNQSLAQMILMIKRGWFFYIGDPKYYILNYIHVMDVAHAVTRCIGSSVALNNEFIISESIRIEEFVMIVKGEVGGIKTLSLPEWLINLIMPIGGCFRKFPLSESRVNVLTSKAKYSGDRCCKYLCAEFPVGIVLGLRLYCRSLMS